MEFLIIFVKCAIMGMGLVIVPATLLALTGLWLMNMYCKKKFGESLFRSKKEREA